jgi:hypothetical protein
MVSCCMYRLGKIIKNKTHGNNKRRLKHIVFLVIIG